MTEHDIQLLKSHFTFWDKLSPHQKDILIGGTTAVSYERGDSIHSADLDCVGVLLIKKGSVRVYILSEDGREITLYRLYDGDICILSAYCVLQSITFDVHIDAVSDCEFLQTNSCAFSQIMQENIYVEAFAYKLASESFSDVMWAMQQVLFMSFDKRLALFLLEESANEQSDTIHMTHEQIARFVGSAREVVTRMLKYFSSEGYVELSRGNVHITNRAGLTSLTL